MKKLLIILLILGAVMAFSVSANYTLTDVQVGDKIVRGLASNTSADYSMQVLNWRPSPVYPNYVIFNFENMDNSATMIIPGTAGFWCNRTICPKDRIPDWGNPGANACYYRLRYASEGLGAYERWTECLAYELIANNAGIGADVRAKNGNITLGPGWLIEFYIAFQPGYIASTVSGGCTDGNHGLGAPWGACGNTVRGTVGDFPVIPLCGDGIVGNTANETCDDGNNFNGDACTNDCNSAYCGDGILWVGQEQCDDGNNNNGDGCNATCMFENGGGQSGEIDWGDAPDDDIDYFYNTTNATNGPWHIIDYSLILGPTIDSELDGQESIGAVDDDINGVDDEDGVYIPYLPSGVSDDIEVDIRGTGWLDVWLDGDGDGTFDHPEELIFSDEVEPGIEYIPYTAPVGDTYLRARLSPTSTGGLTPYNDGGYIGEVEDHYVDIYDAYEEDLGLPEFDGIKTVVTISLLVIAGSLFLLYIKKKK